MDHTHLNNLRCELNSRFVKKFFKQPTKPDTYGQDCINFDVDPAAKQRKLEYDKLWLEELQKTHELHFQSYFGEMTKTKDFADLKPREIYDGRVESDSMDRESCSGT